MANDLRFCGRASGGATHTQRAIALRAALPRLRPASSKRLLGCVSVKDQSATVDRRAKAYPTLADTSNSKSSFLEFRFLTGVIWMSQNPAFSIIAAKIFSTGTTVSKNFELPTT